MVDTGSRGLTVLLVCMPWHGLHLPSLALSTLAPLGRAHRGVNRLDVRYGNIEWAEYLRVASDERLGSAEYLRIADSGMTAAGEWIFSGALYDRDDPDHTGVFDAEIDAAAATEMYHLAPGFVGTFADDICRGGYDVVGFTTTFAQNIPSLALARAVKARSPLIKVIMGGANCDDDQGATLHRNFPFVDYVVRGEAEVTFPQLLTLLGGGPGPAPDTIAGLCWWNGATSVANPMPPGGVSADLIPEPTYDEYFAAHAATVVCAHVRPRIVMEGARGCWWGQKHHCTFCGLNDTTIAFRAKEPDRVLDELRRAVQRHRVLDIVFADNIIDQRYLRDLLPRIAELGWDLRIFFETKSNQQYPQLAQMADAGVVAVQPGIESFSTQVLKLMRKGVTGWQNVRFLRDCRTLGIDPMWNLIYGFPGESVDDYAPMVAQLPHLVHLRPPQDVGRVALTRFSPFFTDPSLGLANLGPASTYQRVYKLPDDELAGLVYLFDCPDAGVGGRLVAHLEAQIRAWQERQPRANLTAFEAGSSRLDIVDERQPGMTIEHALSPAATTVYRALLKGRGLGPLIAMLATHDHAPSTSQIVGLLDDWTVQGLVFRDGDTYVALATGLAYT